MGAVLTERRPLRLENAVRRRRKELDWTVDQLAARAGVSRRTIVDIEGREDYSPGGVVMLKLAAAFDLGLDDLFWSAA